MRGKFVTALAAALSVASLSGSISSAGAAPARLIVKHPRFTRVAAASSGITVLAAGSYQLRPSGADNAGGELLNVVTGARDTVLAPVGCRNGLMSRSAVLFICDPPATSTYQLYSFGSRSVRSLSLAGGPEMLGSAWVQIAQESDPTPHAKITIAFQNLLTGRVVADPRRGGGRVDIDLNSPRLTEKVCSPLTVPSAAAPPDAAAPGSLTMLGDFGLGNGRYPALAKHGRTTMLQRCGTRTQRQIDPVGGQLAANASVVVWQAAPSRLVGFDLPSLRPVQIDLPSSLSGWASSLSLNSRDLYVQASSGATWRLPLRAFGASGKA